MTVNHGVLGSSPCSGADARGLRKGSFKKRLQGAAEERGGSGKAGFLKWNTGELAGWRSAARSVARKEGRRSKSEDCLCSPKPFLRELSSAGSERLPYKQRVGGSNPSAPTTMSATYSDASGFFFDKREHSSVGLERLLDKQEVSGSNPLVPTIFERPARLRVVFCTRLRIPVSPCVRPRDPRKRTVEKWNWDLQMSLICAIFAPANPNSGA